MTNGVKTLLVRFAASLLLTDFVVYLKGNLAPQCKFCGRQQGWPVTYLTEAGLAGDPKFSMDGLLTDIVVSMLSAIVLAVVWSWIAQLLSRRGMRSR